MFDLFYLPLHRLKGEEQPDLPGFLALAAPRNANRHRQEEWLMILLSIARNDIFSDRDLYRLLENAAHGYFKTAGTVTTCVRQMVERLNDHLFRINRRVHGKAPRLSASLNVAVLRRDILFLSQSGPTHSLLLGHSQRLDYYEASGGSELGLSQVARTSYNQTQVHPGDILVFLPDPPDNFAAYVPSGERRISLEQLRRSLSGLTADPLQAAIIQFKAGKGELHRLKPRIPLGTSSAGATSTLEVVEEPDSVVGVEEEISPPVEEDVSARQAQPLRPPRAVETPAPRQVRTVAKPLRMAAQPAVKLSPVEKIQALIFGKQYVYRLRQQKVMRVVVPQRSRLPSVAPGDTRMPHQPGIQPAAPPREPAQATALRQDTPDTPSSIPSVRVPPLASSQMPSGQPVVKAPSQTNEFISMLVSGAKSLNIRRRLASLWRGGQKAQHKIGEGGEKLLTSILPEQPQQTLTMSPALMLFIALAVPLVVVSFAATIYFREGPGRQHQLLLEQSRDLVFQSNEQPDPLIQRANLVQALALLDKAENYLVSDASRNMRIEIQTALDKADRVVRVNFEPVAETIASDVLVRKIQANTTDVYLLDGGSGAVLRLTRFEQNYAQDRNFACSPGPLGGTVVGRLVDIVLLPANSKKATVLGIDPAGNLLYCIPGSPPLSNALIPPDTGWGKISGLFFDRGFLYVMDIERNSVYIYTGDADMVFPNPPREYFDDQIPNMEDVIDFEVNAEDLFLLHRSGRMTRCTFRIHDLNKTRCSDDVYYSDTRYGKTEQLVTFPTAQFIEVVLTLPPDPSLFMLDSNTPAIYHFGPTLVFHRQLEMQLYPNFDKPRRATTAFTVAPGRIIWWAFGNLVFYGQLP